MWCDLAESPGTELMRHWLIVVQRTHETLPRRSRLSGGRWGLFVATALAVFLFGFEATDLAYPMTSDIQQRAVGGDLNAQRELADCLSKGCGDQPSDPALACAWRIVIVASGASDLTAADVEARRLACGDLSPPEQAAALAQAKSLFANIHGRDLIVPADFFRGPTRIDPGGRP